MLKTADYDVSLYALFSINSQVLALYWGMTIMYAACLTSYVDLREPGTKQLCIIHIKCVFFLWRFPD